MRAVAPQGASPPASPADCRCKRLVRPDRPHPLFYGFVRASVEKMEAGAQ